MGRVFVVFLEGKIYSCKHCGTHLAHSEDIMSKSFHCRHGKAYLFDKVYVKSPRYIDINSCAVVLVKVNITFGQKEERMMTTGLHIAADIFCVLCGSLVGWNYETAQEKSQKYKEGKSVLERFKICGPDGSRYWAGHDVHSGGSDADDA